MILFIVPKNSGLEKVKALLNRFQGKILEMRGEDIPLIVSNLSKIGKNVVGITGEDLFTEFNLKKKNNLTILERIKWDDSRFIFGKPVLCLLGPKSKKFKNMPKNVRVCINKKYSWIANQYLRNIKGFTFERFYLSGSTEETFANNLADLVIDIVCSGKSAKEAELCIYDKIFSSDIVVIGDKKRIPNRNKLDCNLDVFASGIDFSKIRIPLKKRAGEIWVVPAIAVDYKTNEILMQAFMDDVALRKTLQTGLATYWSRSREEYWIKGIGSGNCQIVKDISTDCDFDSILLKVEQKGKVSCHTGQRSCFYRKLKLKPRETLLNSSKLTRSKEATIK